MSEIDKTFIYKVALPTVIPVPVIVENSCEGCVFEIDREFCSIHACLPRQRPDGQEVIFIEVKE